MKIILPILLTIVFTISLLGSGNVVSKMGLNVSNNSFINHHFNYQLYLLGIAGLSLIATFLLNKAGFLEYFKLGKLSATGEEVKWLGIKAEDSWLKTGLSLSLVITGITGTFLYFQFKKTGLDWSVLSGGVWWVLLFALMNSFSEEMIYRLGLLGALKGAFSPTVIFLISALIFGVAHVNGTPSGIIGISLAALLGFVLAKSMYETQGFFWAWFIHFLQDVLILGGLFMLKN